MNPSYGGGGRSPAIMGKVHSLGNLQERKVPEDGGVAGPSAGDAQQARRSFPSVPSRAPGTMQAPGGTEMPTRPAIPPPSAPTAPAHAPQPLPPHQSGPPHAPTTTAPHELSKGVTSAVAQPPPQGQWPPSKPAPKNPADHSVIRPPVLPPAAKPPQSLQSAAPAPKMLTTPPAPLKPAPGKPAPVPASPAKPPLPTHTAAPSVVPPAAKPVPPMPTSVLPQNKQPLPPAMQKPATSATPLGAPQAPQAPAPPVAAPVRAPAPTAAPSAAPAPVAAPAPPPAAAPAPAAVPVPAAVPAAVSAPMPAPAPPLAAPAPNPVPALDGPAPPAAKVPIPTAPIAAAAPKPPLSNAPSLGAAPSAANSLAVPVALGRSRVTSIVPSQPSQASPRPKLPQPLPMDVHLGQSLNKPFAPSMTRMVPPPASMARPALLQAKSGTLALAAPPPPSNKASAPPAGHLHFAKPSDLPANPQSAAVAPPPHAPPAPSTLSLAPVSAMPSAGGGAPQAPQAPPPAAAGDAEELELLPDAPYKPPEEVVKDLLAELGRMQLDHLTTQTRFQERAEALEKEIEELKQREARREQEAKRDSDAAEVKEKVLRLQTELARAKAEAAEAQAKAAEAAQAPPPPVPANDEARIIAARVAKLPAPVPAAAAAPGRAPTLDLGTAHLLKKLFFRSQPKRGLAALFSSSTADEAHARKAQELQSALSTCMNPDASPVLLLAPLYSFTTDADAASVENALELVLLLVQSSVEVRKAMLYGAAGASQFAPPLLLPPEHEFARHSVHPLAPRNPRIRLALPPSATPPDPPPPPPPADPGAAEANKILQSLLQELPRLRALSPAALEHAFSLLSTVLEGCPVNVLAALQGLITPHLVFIGDILHTGLQNGTHSLNERVVEFINVIITHPEIYKLAISPQALLSRLVKLLQVRANAVTLPVRHRVVRLFRFCMNKHREHIVPNLCLDQESELYFLDRLVIMLENEIDACCIYPGPAGRIPNAASRLFVGETCYLLWQCLDAVGPRAKLSHKLPLQAIASRIVQGELDPELRSLATFGNYFLSFQYAEAAPMVLITEAEDSEAREQRERERSEGGYSSR